MSRWFEVQIQAWQVIVVEVEDDDEVLESELANEAAEIAFDEAFPFVTEKETGRIIHLTTEDEIESAKRHADEVIPLED